MQRIAVFLAALSVIMLLCSCSPGYSSKTGKIELILNSRVTPKADRLEVNIKDRSNTTLSFIETKMKVQTSTLKTELLSGNEDITAVYFKNNMPILYGEVSVVILPDEKRLEYLYLGAPPAKITESYSPKISFKEDDGYLFGECQNANPKSSKVAIYNLHRDEWVNIPCHNFSEFGLWQNPTYMAKSGDVKEIRAYLVRSTYTSTNKLPSASEILAMYSLKR